MKHLYPLNKEKNDLLGQINKDTFEKYATPFAESEQTLYMTFHPHFRELFNTQKDEKQFREVGHELIGRYSNFMKQKE